MKSQINVCPSGCVNNLIRALLKCWHEQLYPTKPPILEFERYCSLLLKNTKQYIQSRKKKCSQCVTVKSYKRKMNSDIHFKMGDGKTDIQRRRTHRRCCFCLDIHRILNLLLEAGHLWLVYFAECPIGNSGMRRVLGLPHRLSWQPPH